ncbi:scavenger receptor class F member 2-like [Saccostrea cucullata]|uniref:scavenger receptor class F member 2-like n=1 Tax=Saccostrea cuccullata TaxID=36930 RepID=UPI002ED604B1
MGSRDCYRSVILVIICVRGSFNQLHVYPPLLRIPRSYCTFRIEGECIRCMNGYYGDNCEQPCSYPNYGNKCQSKCYCGEDECDHINGCKECMKGYNGSSCDQPCSYPTYGKDCLSTCNCEEEYCNHTTGCKGMALSK